MFEEEEVSIEALDDTAKDESIDFYLELRENFNEFYGEVRRNRCVYVSTFI